MAGVRWTNEEEILLRNNYEHATENELRVHFPHRTYASIKQRANRYNNLRKKCLNKFIILDTHTIMIVKNNEGKTFEVLIDNEDVSKVQSHHSSWVVMKNREDVYYVGDTNSYKLHRLIMNPPNNLVVDHIFHNTLDNRKQYLRVVTVAENNRNRQNKKAG